MTFCFSLVKNSSVERMTTRVRERLVLFVVMTKQVINFACPISTMHYFRILNSEFNLIVIGGQRRGLVPVRVKYLKYDVIVTTMEFGK